MGGRGTQGTARAVTAKAGRERTFRVGPGQDFFLNVGKFLLGKSPLRQANFRQISRSFHRPVKFAPTPNPLLLAAPVTVHTQKVAASLHPHGTLVCWHVGIPTAYVYGKSVPVLYYTTVCLHYGMATGSTIAGWEGCELR